MRILLTGATGYIGKRLLPALIAGGHEVICCVRNPKKFQPPKALIPQIEIIEIDLLDEDSLNNIPSNIDAAYYLVHSMAASSDYQSLEKASAINFRNALSKTDAKHVVYLSGIVNEKELSKHLESRKTVEHELSNGKFHLTTLRAGIIIGSGSASFEIIRDLVEKLPVMVTPKWLNTRCQPIGVSDVISFLSISILNPKVYDQDFDIGGPDILSYREMLLKFAKVRNLKRFIYTVPVMTPRLSSYWLYFVTSTSYRLAIALVNSMKIEVICRDVRINDLLNVYPDNYRQALEKAFDKVINNEIVSGWEDAVIRMNDKEDISDFIKVPTYGCYKIEYKKSFNNQIDCINKIWSIGGENGWYYGNWLWKQRGYLDKLFGGIGFRKGRAKPDTLNVDENLDYWRVLYANKSEGRLILYGEMKMPGEVWLEFNVNAVDLGQTLTFRPLGLKGIFYWYSFLPLRKILFKGMINKLTENHD